MAKTINIKGWVLEIARELERLEDEYIYIYINKRNKEIKRLNCFRESHDIYTCFRSLYRGTNESKLA